MRRPAGEGRASSWGGIGDGGGRVVQGGGEFEVDEAEAAV